MPFYQSKGKSPSKRHTVFKKNNRKEIYYEELISREGFSNLYSNIYHIHMPTRLKKVGSLDPFKKNSNQQIEGVFAGLAAPFVRFARYGRINSIFVRIG